MYGRIMHDIEPVPHCKALRDGVRTRCGLESTRHPQRNHAKKLDPQTRKHGNSASFGNEENAALVQGELCGVHGR